MHLKPEASPASKEHHAAAAEAGACGRGRTWKKGAGYRRQCCWQHAVPRKPPQWPLRWSCCACWPTGKTPFLLHPICEKCQTDVERFIARSSPKTDPGTDPGISPGTSPETVRGPVRTSPNQSGDQSGNQSELVRGPVREPVRNQSGDQSKPVGGPVRGLVFESLKTDRIKVPCAATVFKFVFAVFVQALWVSSQPLSFPLRHFHVAIKRLARVHVPSLVS